MKTSAKTTKQEMKTIQTGFDINKDAMHLNIKVEKNGETIVDEKGNSILFHFLAELAMSMNGGSTPWDEAVPYSNNRTTYQEGGIRKNASYVMPVIDGFFNGTPESFNRPHQFTITSWDGNTITVSHNASNSVIHFIREAEMCCLTGDSSYSGNYKVLSITSITSTSTELTLDGLNIPTGEAIDANAVVAAKVLSSWDDYGNGIKLARSFAFEVTNILVGNSADPVSLHDVYLPGYLDSSIIEISSGEPQISTPTIAVDSSQIAISQQFTNKSGVLQIIREMGLMARASHDSGTSGYDRIVGRDGENKAGHNGVALLARDAISPFQVADQESFTITYEFKITASGKSGVVAGFNEMMYRELSSSNRIARDYFNTDWDASDASGSIDRLEELNKGCQFYIWPLHFNMDSDLSFFGLQVGTNEDDIDIDDYYMRDATSTETRIPHGGYDGSLWYHPTYVKEVVTSGNQAYISLEALYENRGSVDVTIKEVALNGGYNRRNPVLLTRNVLDVADHITLQPGEVAKIIYRIGISTGA